MAVVHDGRPLVVRGFGNARLAREDSDSESEPVTEHTKFAIASLSKAFTATLIGILLKEQEMRSASISLYKKAHCFIGTYSYMETTDPQTAFMPQQIYLTIF